MILRNIECNKGSTLSFKVKKNAIIESCLKNRRFINSRLLVVQSDVLFLTCCFFTFQDDQVIMCEIGQTFNLVVNSNRRKIVDICVVICINIFRKQMHFNYYFYSYDNSFHKKNPELTCMNQVHIYFTATYLKIYSRATKILYRQEVIESCSL